MIEKVLLTISLIYERITRDKVEGNQFLGYKLSLKP